MEHQDRYRREQYWANTGGHPYQYGAYGHHPGEQDSRMDEQPLQMNRQMQIEEAILIARERVPGQVVQAELDRRNGQLVYEIDIITAQGIKYEVVVDAVSGMVLMIDMDT